MQIKFKDPLTNKIKKCLIIKITFCTAIKNDEMYDEMKKTNIHYYYFIKIFIKKIKLCEIKKSMKIKISK